MNFNYDSLYQIFSKYQKPTTFDSCHCCLSEKDKDYLLSNNLIYLTGEDLYSYATSVFLTVGGIADFKYFFPKILELCLEGKLCDSDPEIIFKSISNANWEEWPIDEKEIVISLVNQKFESFITSETYGVDIDSWLCAIANLKSDISSYLDQLLRLEYRNSALEFLSWNIEAYSTGILPNRFWADWPSQEKQVLFWLENTKVKELLQFVDKKGMC